VPTAALADVGVAVVGVGSIGRQVALQLAAIGVPLMVLYDPDVVGPENLGTQGYWQDDLESSKVQSTANVCHHQHPMLEMHALSERFSRTSMRRWSEDRRWAVFCCVDSIGDRRFVWDSVKRRAAFFSDGRLAAETIRVLASDQLIGDAEYPKSLFDASEAFTGRCTAKSTIYAANIAAGLMVAQFARWLRGLPVVRDQLFDLLAVEWTELVA